MGRTVTGQSLSSRHFPYASRVLSGLVGISTGIGVSGNVFFKGGCFKSHSSTLCGLPYPLQAVRF